ncbi:hypothetical protein J4407_02205 [Candidatus Pacearchaeota archaeon]|nr:hypothetical protein [Candidatus Pacearchaeota archaeon]
MYRQLELNLYGGINTNMVLLNEINNNGDVGHLEGMLEEINSNNNMSQQERGYFYNKIRNRVKELKWEVDLGNGLLSK